MKIWFALFLVGAILVILFYPDVNRERLCYTASQDAINDIAANVLNQRLTKDMECSQSTEVLSNLESCMQEATKSSTVALYANDTVQRLVAIIRPYAKNLWTMKAEHNAACADFSSDQLE